jgi:hypothetical protein
MLKKYNLLRTAAVIGYVSLFSTILIYNPNGAWGLCTCECKVPGSKQWSLIEGGVANEERCQKDCVWYVQHPTPEYKCQ